MNLIFRDKLIHESKYYSSYRHSLVIVYAFISLAFLMLMSFIKNGSLIVDFYFAINGTTVLLLSWFIRSSCSVFIPGWNMNSFRTGLFFLLNSTLITISGELSLLKKNQSEMIAALIYIPAICLIIYAFKKFIRVVNIKYKNVFELSLTDYLTGLPNRRFLGLKLNEVEEHDCKISILDIDDFKLINDTYGHEVGDRVLRELGLLLKNFKDENTFIARSGGEEFCIIDTSLNRERNVASEVKKAISIRSFEGLSITMSIGVAQKNRRNSSSQSMTAADVALYESKKNGKNTISYSES